MKRIPKQIVELVKHHQVLLSAKAQQQLDVGIFDTDDLIHSILYGEL
jgi:hypothetical protein